VKRSVDVTAITGSPATTMQRLLSFSFTGRRAINGRPVKEKERKVSVCKVRTQNPESFDEEVKSLVSAWRSLLAGQLKDLTDNTLNS